MEKSYNDLHDYIQEKLNDSNDRYDERKATLDNDTIAKLKAVLEEEISKVNEKLEGKIYQICQNKSFLQEQIAN